MSTLNNERKNVRYPSQARARVAESFEGDALLKDISITGCRIECTTYVDIKPNRVYKIEVIPETAANTGKFELTAEARWVRVSDSSCVAGFLITASPKGKLFQRYVDYLDWRSS